MSKKYFKVILERALVLAALIAAIFSTPAVTMAWLSDGGGPIPIQDRFKRATLVCIGTGFEIQSRENGTFHDFGAEIQGQWSTVSFQVTDVLKGPAVKQVLVHVFTSFEGWPGFTVPSNQRCALFLEADLNKPGYYILLDQRGPIILLSDPRTWMAVETYEDPYERLSSEILHAANDPNPSVAIPAIGWSVYACNRANALTELWGLSKLDATSTTRLACLAARLRMHDGTALTEIANLPEGAETPADQRTRAASMDVGWAIESFKGTGATEALVQIMNRKNTTWRSAASMAIRENLAPQTVPIFFGLIDDPDPRIQYNVIEGLALFTRRPGASYKGFIADKAKYVADWKLWWNAEGKATYGVGGPEK